MTFAEVAADAARVLTRAGLPNDDARRDAAVLARDVLGWDAARWVAHQRDSATEAFAAALTAAVARRAAHEPVAYITGRREFYGRDFHVNRDVLVPRPETELVVDVALAALRSRAARIETADSEQLTIVDVGTGSGCLAITLALEWPSARVIATDVSAAALDVAAANAARLGAASGIEFRHATFVGDLVSGADLIVSNPPYIAEADRQSLPPDVRDYEPPSALFGGPDGLDVVRALVPAAARALRRGGVFIVEIGAGQHERVAELIAGTSGLGRATIHHDLQGVARVLGTEPFSTDLR